MRLDYLLVRNTQPVQFFEASALADVIVLAGPNGVGKSRLLDRLVSHLRGAGGEGTVHARIAATRPEENTAWGKAVLDLNDSADLNHMRQTLQTGRRRQRWSSSLITFESDRSIQNIQPYQFTWDMKDPMDEEASWESTFAGLRGRFQDTLHTMFRMIEAQKQAIANRAVQLRREGRSEMKLDFADPMAEFKRIFSMLLAPKELVDPSARDQRLRYVDEGNERDFATLSSGEREVVNIAFDFLLRRPEDCIVFFDEPELHLHPELSYKLLQTLRSIGARNQFFLSTHSPDVITASLDQSVIFLSPPRAAEGGQPLNQAIAVTENDETHQALRLLGQSIGIIALGKRIVLIEGDQASLDKQTYGAILASRHPGLVLVPSGGKQMLVSFDTVLSSVLNRTVWGVDFRMLCDGDSTPRSSSAVDDAARAGRLRVLPRYHLENYFLDEFVWAHVFSSMEPLDSALRDPAQIRQALRDLARPFVSYAASLAAQHELRMLVGNVDVMPKGSHNKALVEVQGLVAQRAREEIDRVRGALDSANVGAVVERSYLTIQDALDRDDESWKALVPGRPLVNAFAHKAGLSEARAKTMYIRAAPASDREPFAEIIAIFDDFVRGETVPEAKPDAAATAAG